MCLGPLHKRTNPWLNQRSDQLTRRLCICRQSLKNYLHISQDACQLRVVPRMRHSPSVLIVMFIRLLVWICSYQKASGSTKTQQSIKQWLKEKRHSKTSKKPWIRSWISRGSSRRNKEKKLKNRKNARTTNCNSDSNKLLSNSLKNNSKRQQNSSRLWIRRQLQMLLLKIRCNQILKTRKWLSLLSPCLPKRLRW